MPAPFSHYSRISRSGGGALRMGAGQKFLSSSSPNLPGIHQSKFGFSFKKSVHECPFRLYVSNTDTISGKKDEKLHLLNFCLTPRDKP
jgi:hypothetical protein